MEIGSAAERRNPVYEQPVVEAGSLVDIFLRKVERLAWPIYVNKPDVIELVKEMASVEGLYLYRKA